MRELIADQVHDLIETSQANIDAASPEDPDAARALKQPLIGFSEAMHAQHWTLKQHLHERLYRHYRVHRMTTKAARVIEALFETLMSDTQLLPPQFREAAEARESARGLRGRARVVADYIAGMTDRFALDEHERLLSPKRLT